MDSRKNIFLIGLMGSGKSTVGRQLANLTGKEFFDADTEIEKRTGANIPLIFEIEGERGFRKREKDMIRELTAKEEIILATGGGAVLIEENRRRLRKRGWVVYLETDIKTLLKRTKRDSSRPLLQNDNPEATLQKMLEERDPLYLQTADFSLQSGNGSTLQVAKNILAEIEKRSN